MVPWGYVWEWEGERELREIDRDRHFQSAMTFTQGQPVYMSRVPEVLIPFSIEL